MNKAKSQCQYLTSKGTQCTRHINNPPSIYCWQHQNCKTDIGNQAQPKTKSKRSLNDTTLIGRFLTGIADVDMLVLLQMDDKTLATTCRTNKYAKSICDNNNFWRRKVEQLPNRNNVKPVDSTWKDYYRYLTETVNIPIELKPHAVLIGGGGGRRGYTRTRVPPRIFDIKLPKDIVEQINRLYYERNEFDIAFLAGGYMEERIPELSRLVVDQLRLHPEYFTSVYLDSEDPSIYRIQPTLLYNEASDWIPNNFDLANTYPAVMRYNFGMNKALTSIRVETI
jgi:hypothetical protein